MISAAVYVLGSLWVSANYLVVRKYEVHAGSAGAGLKVVVIGDLHDHEFGEDK